MNKPRHGAIITFLVCFLVFPAILLADETLTITTYYPSPYGSYNYLQTDKLGVGDNNGDSSLTSADVPTNSGDVWIKGNVGIGTTSPGAHIETWGNTNGFPTTSLSANEAGLRVSGGGTNAILDFGSKGAGPASGWIQARNRNDYTLDYSLLLNPNGGNVGIGSTNPGYGLEVDGTVGISQANATYIITSSSTSGYTTTFTMDNTGFRISQNSGSRDIRIVANTGGVTLAAGATAWAAISDERLKDILTPLDNGVEKLKGLRTIYYKLKSDASGTRRVGLIAQDVQKVLPEAVSVDADGYLRLRYTELIPPIIKAIQEQQDIIQAQQLKINGLKARLDKLEGKQIQAGK